MRILHVISGFLPAKRYGGPIYALHGLALAQLRLGHQVEVMTTDVDGTERMDVPLGRLVDTQGVPTRYFPIETPKRWWFSRPMGRALRDLAGGFDVVHAHSIFLWPTTAAAYWARRLGVPFIVRPAGSLGRTTLSSRHARSRCSAWVSRARKAAYLRTLARWELRRADAIHFTSRQELEDARRLRLEPPAFVVPLGVDEAPAPSSPRAPLRERHPLLRGKKVVLFLSRVSPIKGLDVLIPALGRLARGRDDFAFVLAGGEEPGYEGAARALVEKCGLADRTLIRGLVQGEEKRQLLAEADLFALTSYHENFGLAVAEALAAGLPAVVSEHVAIQQEIAQARAGLAVRLDVGEVAEAIGRLLSDDELRRSMGRRAGALARERFSWPAVSAATIRMYDEVIASHRARAA
jgi:glycosyltransferase involved in cell wall biosynthesis